MRANQLQPSLLCTSNQYAQVSCWISIVLQIWFKHLIAKILPTFSPVLERGIHNSLQVVIAGGHHYRPRRPIHLLPALHYYLQSNVHAL